MSSIIVSSRTRLQTGISRRLTYGLKRFSRFTNALGSKKKCYICGSTFNNFTKFRKGSKGKNQFLKKLNMVGSDPDNFGCMYCGCTDRERHLFMFFDKLGLWESMKGAHILHFAPEKHLPIKISKQFPLEYVKGDLFPKNADEIKIDATDIPFAADKFNFVIANHILEHISDYEKALAEFYRVLKLGGIAILQTPYSKLLKDNFEDEAIDTDELRLFFHGQENHVRTFGYQQFMSSIEAAGFKLQIKKHKDYFDAYTTFYYGVNSEEDLVLVQKPVTLQV